MSTNKYVAPEWKVSMICTLSWIRRTDAMLEMKKEYINIKELEMQA